MLQCSKKYLLCSKVVPIMLTILPIMFIIVCNDLCSSDTIINGYIGSVASWSRSAVVIYGYTEA
jgi:hypothetical protein